MIYSIKNAYSEEGLMGSKIVRKRHQPQDGAIKVEKKKKEHKKSDENLRGIVRIAGYDILGNVPLVRALTKIQGIGLNLAKVISVVVEKELGISQNTLVGTLDDSQISRIEDLLAHINEHVPKYMLNWQKESVISKDSRGDSHFIGNDLIFMVRTVIDKEKKLYTWKGYRFLHGQKVRGQRTRTTGRKGMTVGVLRKSALTKSGAAAQQEAGKGGGAPSAGPAIGPQKPVGGPSSAKQPVEKK